jgi:hypothetical protein
MSTQRLSVGTNSTPSSDHTVTASETIYLNDAAGTEVNPGAQVEIQIKDPSGEYFRIDTLTGGSKPGVVIAPGVYRYVRRTAVSCGVVSNG